MLWIAIVLDVLLLVVLGRLFGPTAGALVALIVALLLIAGQLAGGIRHIRRSNRARSLGCPDDEMESVSGDQVAWRGAVYSGVAMTEPSSSTSSQPES